MRKILPILIAAAVFLTPLYPVYAQTSDVAPAPSASPKKITKPTAASAAAKLNAAKDRMEETRDKAADMKDKMATRAAELKAKLARFRDKVKASKVENINSNLAAVNLKRTSQMQQSSNRLQAIVTKLKTWVSEQEAAGKDVADLKKAIADTESLWTAADSAIKDQADNDYTISINSESTVKADAKASRDALHNDLKMVHDKLINVRQTLATALSSWKGGN